MPMLHFSRAPLAALEKGTARDFLLPFITYGLTTSNQLLVSRGVGAVYWDNDGDLFGERSGWLSGEDGFLVHDADGSGTIDAAELFGGPGLSGYAELAEWDSNGDGIVSADDIAFADLQIWRDANENGITDAGELHALAAFGITAFSLNAQATNITTANGTIIRAESFYAREDGSTGALGELIFETERGRTRYLGDDRVAAFVPKGVGGEALDAFGYGVTTDLAVAASRLRALTRNVPANDNDESAWCEATFTLAMVA